jgi:hypothetical protein
VTLSQTHLSWSTTAVSGTVGYTVPAPFRVRTGAGYVARRVVVQRRKAGTTAWTPVSSSQTTATGHGTVGLAAPTTGVWQFRVVAPTTATAAAALTPVRRFTGITGASTTITGWSTNQTAIQPGGSLSVPLRVQSGAGYVARPLQVQRRRAGATTWSTLTTGTTTADGRYTAKLTAPAGAWQFRVVAAVTQTARAWLTASRAITVRDTKLRCV